MSKTTVKPHVPRISAKNRAKAAAVRATLPPQHTSDKDVVDMAKSLADFHAAVTKARNH